MGAKTKRVVEIEKDPYKVAFGAEVRRLREECNLSQRQLAAKLSMSRSAICMIESGTRSPGASKYEAFASALGVTPTELMEAAFEQN